MSRNRYYGKYRGKVLENIDPLVLGRIIAEVAAVPGALTNWAMPCTPYAGFQVGFYTIPPIGANVWIEFEGGDPNFPIWSGCFWAEGEVPLESPPTSKVFKTEFITMILNDIEEAGGFTLECISPAVDVPLSMFFNSEGIKIICPEAVITMTPESINLTVPEAVINMTAETIELTVPPSTMTMTAEAVAIETPDVTVEAEAGIEMNAGADVEIAAGGAAELSGGGDVTIDAGGAAELMAGADVNVGAGAAVEIEAGADIAIAAGAAIELAAVGDVSITSITTAITSLVEVTGDLLIDGQQPLVI
jgi:hypothetical protein